MILSNISNTAALKPLGAQALSRRIGKTCLQLFAACAIPLVAIIPAKAAFAAPAVDPIFSVGINSDGRQELFYRGSDGALNHRWQNAPSSGWSGEGRFGGFLTSAPVVGKNASGALEVFYRGGDSNLYHRWQAAGSWSGEERMPDTLTGQPAVATNADGRQELFYRGTDNGLWHRWQLSPNAGWSGAQSLGGVLIASPAVARNADGRLQVFVIGTDGALWTASQYAPGGGWSGFASLGGSWPNPPAIARNVDGRLQLFLVGGDNALYVYTQNAANAAGFGLAKLGGYLSSAPAVGTNQSGALEVYYRGGDNALWHRWQLAPNGGWSGEERMGGVLTSAPVVGYNTNGTQEVYYRGGDNTLWHRWQLLPNAGWSGEERMGNVATEPNGSTSSLPAAAVAEVEAYCKTLGGNDLEQENLGPYTVPGYEGFPTTLFRYGMTDSNGVRKTGTVVMMNPSRNQLARWIVQAVIDAKGSYNFANAKTLALYTQSASGFQFPVRGVHWEDMSGSGVHVAYPFRDGVTVQMRRFGASYPTRVLTSADLDYIITAPESEVTLTATYARIQSTTRQEYINAGGTDATAGHAWRTAVRNAYKAAWGKDRNLLMTAKAKSIL